MLVNDDDGEMVMRRKRKRSFWESIESIMMDAQFKIVVDARFMLINDDADDEEFWESRIMSLDICSTMELLNKVPFIIIIIIIKLGLR